MGDDFDDRFDGKKLGAENLNLILLQSQQVRQSELSSNCAFKLTSYVNSEKCS